MPASPTSITTPASLAQCSALLRDIDGHVSLRDDIQTLLVNGDAVIVKPLRAARKSCLATLAMRMACRLIFKASLDTAAIRRRSPGYEADRLRGLRRLGWPVPTVYLETGRYMVMQHCGPSVETLLKRMAPTPRLALLQRITDDLADFHGTGQWHGGAQLRNLTLQDDVLYRIDFEEPIGDAVPLPLAQAFDVALYLASASDLLAPDGGDGAALLTRYLDAAPRSEVIGYLQRLRRVVTGAAWALARTRGSRRQTAEVRRVHALSRMLAQAL